MGLCRMWVRLNLWDYTSWVDSYTVKQLLDASDPDYLRHGERKQELVRPSIHKVYGSTVEYHTLSSRYKDNQKIWTQKILFKDFIVLAKDKGISIIDAIEYAVNDGDVTVTCNCPAFLYWGYKYIATQLGYLYGIPKENRRPKRNNVGLRGTVCKHAGRVLDTVLRDKEELISKFSALYRKAQQPWLDTEAEGESIPEDVPLQNEGTDQVTDEGTHFGV